MNDITRRTHEMVRELNAMVGGERTVVIIVAGENAEDSFPNLTTNTEDPEEVLQLGVKAAIRMTLQDEPGNERIREELQPQGGHAA